MAFFLNYKNGWELKKEKSKKASWKIKTGNRKTKGKLAKQIGKIHKKKPLEPSQNQREIQERKSTGTRMMTLENGVWEGSPKQRLARAENSYPLWSELHH